MCRDATFMALSGQDRGADTGSRISISSALHSASVTEHERESQLLTLVCSMRPHTCICTPGCTGLRHRRISSRCYSTGYFSQGLPCSLFTYAFLSLCSLSPACLGLQALFSLQTNLILKLLYLALQLHQLQRKLPPCELSCPHRAKFA